MANFLLWAWLGGLMIAAVAGPLGSFMVWRRMAYFGDTLAHAALLGVALGLLLQVNISLAVVLVCLLLALLLSTLVHKRIIATDTLLGILSHASLSLGLVSLSLFDHQSIDLMGFLFGDLLAIGQHDLLWIALACCLVLVILVSIWTPLLSITVNEELAQVEGINVAWYLTDAVSGSGDRGGNEGGWGITHYFTANYTCCCRSSLVQLSRANGVACQFTWHVSCNWGVGFILVL